MAGRVDLFYNGHVFITKAIHLEGEIWLRSSMEKYRYWGYSSPKHTIWRCSIRIIKSRWFPWPSLSICPYRPLFPAGLLNWSTNCWIFFSALMNIWPSAHLLFRWRKSLTGYNDLSTNTSESQSFLYFSGKVGCNHLKDCHNTVFLCHPFDLWLNKYLHGPILCVGLQHIFSIVHLISVRSKVKAKYLNPDFQCEQVGFPLFPYLCYIKSIYDM